MNLQGESPSYKHGNTWEGTRDSCKRAKPDNYQGKRASTTQKKSETKKNIETHREKETKLARGATERCALEMTNGTS